MAGSTYLTRSISSTGNRKKWTWSGWLKRTTLDRSYIFSSTNWGSGSDKYSTFFIENNFTLNYYDYTSDYQSRLVTNRVFRDVNCYYHIVITYDSGQSTSSDRIKFYINGVQETSFSTASYPSQDYDSFVNLSGVPLYLGRESGTGSLFDGIMSHVHFCDGYAYAASDFGETDSTTGEWKIKTSPSVSYGTNGYFLFKDNASVNDQSGNNNNFTLTAGTLTPTQDNPSNVFATLNSLLKLSSVTFSNGNNTASHTSTGHQSIFSTIGFDTGKYYFEAKLESKGNFPGIGFGSDTDLPSSFLGESADSVNYFHNGTIYKNNSDAGGTFASFTTGDIIGVALDMDNNNVYFSKNGTWQNSGDPTSGSTGTGAISTTAGVKLFAVDVYGATTTWSTNFGNGYFGTTAVSSAGTNASNIGIFEYNVPTGYTALSTKGLNT